MVSAVLQAALLLATAGIVLGARVGQQRRLQQDVPPSGICYSFNTTGVVTGTPALDTGILYFASSGSPGKMYAVDSFTATSLWEVTCPVGTDVSDPSPAAFSNFQAFMGCSNGVFYALDVELDGQVKWRYPLASDKKTKLGSVRGAPIVAGGVVYLVADKTATNVYAFNSTTGDLLWKSSQKFTGLAKNAGGVTLNKGILYGGTDAGTVFALNATTGATLWTYTAPSGATIRSGGSILVAEDLVVFGAGSSLTALKAGKAGGKVAWAVSFSPTYIVSGVAYSEQTGPVDPFANANSITGTVVASLSAASSAKSGGVVAVAAATGASRLAPYSGWVVPSDCSAVPYQAAVASDLIYIPCYNSATKKGAVYSFDLAQSLQDKAWSLAWYTPVSDGVASGLALDANGIAIFGSAKQQLQSVTAFQYLAPDGTPSCLAPSTPPPRRGALCWNTEVAGMPRPVPTMVNDTLYWPSDLGYLYAMDATTGQIQWKWEVEEQWQGGLANLPGVPTYIPSRGLLMYLGPDWVLYALKLTKTGATRKWRFPPATATNDSGNSTIGLLRGPVTVDLKRNALYFATSLPIPGSHGIYAINIDSGLEVWRQPFTGPGASSVSLAFDGDILYGGDNSGFVFAVNATDGSRIWEYDAKDIDDPLKFIVTGGPMRVAENILFFCCGTRLVAVSAGAKGGSLLWQKRVVDTPQFTYSVGYSPLSFQAKDPLNPDSFTNAGTVFVASAGPRATPAEEGTGGVVRAFVTTSGQEVMKTFYTGPYCSDMLSAPLIKDDIMYLACNNVTRTNPGVIYAIDLKASLAIDPANVPVKVLWQYITAGGISNHLFVDDYKNVYYGNNYNVTFAVAGSRTQCRSTLFSRRPPPAKSTKPGRLLLR